RRGIRGLPLQALAADVDGLLEVTVLAQLLRELGEQPGAGVLLQPPAEVVDPRVPGHTPSERNGPRSTRTWDLLRQEPPRLLQGQGCGPHPLRPVVLPAPGVSGV